MCAGLFSSPVIFTLSHMQAISSYLNIRPNPIAIYSNIIYMKSSLTDDTNERGKYFLINSIQFYYLKIKKTPKYSEILIKEASQLEYLKIKFHSFSLINKNDAMCDSTHYSVVFVAQLNNNI